MPRLMLTDEHWSKLEAMMLEASIYGKPNLRMTVEGILYRMRTGCPWRDLPREFGDWNAIYKRYNAWSHKDIFSLLFSKLSSFTDTEWTFIDASFVKAHQHSAGAIGHAPQAIGQIVDLDKLVRYQAGLVTLLNNFVSFSDFYTRKDKAIFQAGTLFIDGRGCDLTIQVSDMAKHASMAGLSNAYLVYCDCTRKHTNEKTTIVAAVTAGDAGNLMVGRNGIFYDRAGKDWDATVVKIIENAISVREAFWTPYRRLGRMLNNQIQKMAADQDKAIEAKTADSVSATASKAQEAAKAPADAKAAPPAPFDVAKFAGIFAAIGLAVGALGTALAAMMSGFLALIWWQMPIAILGLLLIISGPSMVLAWFKLRQRNLSPLLDANGWAVNTNAKVSIAFGTTLTVLASLPKGAKRELKDPFA
jgi:transposase